MGDLMTQPAARTLVIGVLLCLVFGACGSTVPVAQRRAIAGSELASGAATGSPGAAAADGEGGVTAVAGSTSGPTGVNGAVASTGTGGRTSASGGSANAPAASATGPITVGFLVSDYTKTAAAFGVTGPPT